MVLPLPLLPHGRSDHVVLCPANYAHMCCTHHLRPLPSGEPSAATPDGWYAHVAGKLPLHLLPRWLVASLRHGLTEHEATVRGVIQRRKVLLGQLATLLPASVDAASLVWRPGLASQLSKRLQAERAQAQGQQGQGQGEQAQGQGQQGQGRERGSSQGQQSTPNAAGACGSQSECDQPLQLPQSWAAAVGPGRSLVQAREGAGAGGAWARAGGSGSGGAGAGAGGSGSRGAGALGAGAECSGGVSWARCGAATSRGSDGTAFIAGGRVGEVSPALAPAPPLVPEPDLLCVIDELLQKVESSYAEQLDAATKLYRNNVPAALVVWVFLSATCLPYQMDFPRMAGALYDRFSSL